MNTRILHCSNSLENYYLCLEHRVAGFSNRGPQPGDLVYLVVKVGKKSLCGARFVLDEPSDHKPWADADNYVNALSVSNIEFCKAGSRKNPTTSNVLFAGYLVRLVQKINILNRESEFALTVK